MNKLKDYGNKIIKILLEDKNVKVKKINNEDFVCFLNVGTNSTLLFENKKPVVLNKRNK